MKNWQLVFQYALAAIIVLGFMILLAYIVHTNCLNINNTGSVLTTLLGSFATMTVTVVSYFFGSSKGSADKNEMLYNSTPTNNTPPPQQP